MMKQKDPVKTKARNKKNVIKAIIESKNYGS